MRIELRSGFCDPDGELLATLDRPEWERISRQRKGDIVGEMIRLCEELGLWDVEAWRRNAAGEPQHIIATGTPRTCRAVADSASLAAAGDRPDHARSVCPGSPGPNTQSRQ